MAKPRPVTITQMDAADYDGVFTPEPLLVVGDIGAFDPQPAIANIATADGSDPATTQALANATKAKVNAILAALRAAGVIAE